MFIIAIILAFYLPASVAFFGVSWKAVNHKSRTMQAALAAAIPHDDDILLTTLRERFGLSDFREGQREIVDTVVRGEDALVVNL